MLLIALAATVTATEQPPNRPAAPIAEQAKATVRILSGATITADRPPPDALVRDAQVLRADGSRATARFVEFP